MCPKVAEGEIASMKSLMTTVVNAVVVEVFGLDASQIRPELGLRSDLRMNPEQQARLTAMIEEYFDGLRLQIGAGTTLGDVYAQVTGP